MKMTIALKNMEKSLTVENPQHVPRVGDHIDMGIGTNESKVIRVLWTEFPDFNDVFIIVD